jgi:hypothetical protein
MRDAITNYLPWLMSLVTIVAIELQGRKWPKAWALSLAGQGFWFLWIACSKQWGFMPMAAVLCVQYARNHWRWVAEARALPREFDAPELENQ